MDWYRRVSGVTPIQWAVLGGVAAVAGAASIFGILRGGPTLLINAVIVLFFAGAAGAAGTLAVISAVARKKNRYEVFALLLFFLIGALGILYLALLEDVEPFISTLTNTVLAILMSWIVFNRSHVFSKPIPRSTGERPRGRKRGRATLRKSREAKG